MRRCKLKQQQDVTLLGWLESERLWQRQMLVRVPDDRNSLMVGTQDAGSSLEDKVWQFHIKLSGFLINWAPGKLETWRNLKCAASERGHSGKSVSCLAPTNDILENGKAVGMVKSPVVSMVGEGHSRRTGRPKRTFKVAKKKNFEWYWDDGYMS